MMASAFYRIIYAVRQLSQSSRKQIPIIPSASITGKSLIAVVAIMSFLAALTIGAVILVLSSAGEWQSDIAREMTIQIRPFPGHDIDAEVANAAALARSIPGIIDVRPYSKEESESLLEPWLGSGLSLDSLPVPRLIVLRVAPGARLDLNGLRAALSQRIAGASLDDHRGWIDRMRIMANTAIFGGLIILVLVLAATVLSVAFATRGAMSTNQAIVEVLHFIGAEDSFIARQFQSHFLILGLQGGAIGGGSALLLFALAGTIGNQFISTASGEQAAALFGTFSLGITGYFAVLGQIVLVALVTAFTSRQVVKQTLNAIE